MKKIKFTMGFQGSETRNRFYERGVEYEVEDSLADLMVKDERAVFVIEEKPVVIEADVPVSPPQDYEIDEPELKPRKRNRKHETIDN